MQKNTLCCIFGKKIDRKRDFPTKQFKAIKDYGDIDAPNDCIRKLVRCFLCDKLFLYQFLEYDTADQDHYYTTYVQVNSEEQADDLNKKTNWLTIEEHVPSIKLNDDGSVIFDLEAIFKDGK